MFRVEDVKTREVSVLSLKELCDAYRGKVYLPLVTSSFLQSIVIRDEEKGNKVLVTRVEDHEKE